MPEAKHFAVEGGVVIETDKDTAPKRDWLDYGKDTGPRVRVKDVLEGKALEDRQRALANEMPSDVDKAEAAEVQAEGAAAIRDGDDRKVGRIYEDLLDEMHSPNLGERTPDEKLQHAWAELEAALIPELRELGRAEGATWGYRLTDAGLSVRRVQKGQETFEVRLDKKALQTRIVHAYTDARESAQALVSRVNAEVSQARASMMVGGSVPFEREDAKA